MIQLASNPLNRIFNFKIFKTDLKKKLGGLNFASMSTKCCLAAAKQHEWLQVESLIKQGYAMDPELTTLAASQGQKWALEMFMEYGCEWSENTLLMAAWYDYELCFNYALAHGATITVMAVVTLINKPFIRAHYIDRLFNFILTSHNPILEQDFIPLLEATAVKNFIPLVKQLYAYNSTLFQSSQLKNIIIQCTYHHINAIDCALFLLSKYIKYNPIDSPLFQACLNHDAFLPYTQPIIEDVFSLAPEVESIQRQLCSYNYRLTAEHLPTQHKLKVDLQLLYSIQDCVQSIYFVEPVLKFNSSTIWLMLSYYPSFRNHPRTLGILVKYIDKFITTELYLKHVDILDLVMQDWFYLRSRYKPLYYVVIQKCYMQAAAITATKELQRFLPSCVVSYHVSTFIKGG